MRKTKYHVKKKIMPLLLAVAMAGTATPIYVAHPAIVKAAVSNAFGTNKISLSAGSYTVPVSLKKADNVEQNSMAAGAVGENATLEVAEDGTASLEVELKALNLYGMTGAAKDLKVYQGNDIKSETKDATVLIVAQRISTILHAEQIVVLDEGKVVGIGNHKQLLKNCEVYKEIALSQLSKEELENE